MDLQWGQVVMVMDIEMFAKQKQQGVSDEEADTVAMQNAKFGGAKETAIGASLPFMGGAGSKLF